MGLLSMIRGDTRTIAITIQPVDALGTQVLGSSGITGWLFWLTAKRDLADADAAAVLQKIPSAWQVQTAGNTTTAGVAICTLDPADTASLAARRIDLYYDIQAKDTSGSIFTLDIGTLTVNADVTNATS